VTHPADQTAAAWRAAIESGDAAAATACLAPDVQVISPLTAEFRFSGPAQVGDMLAAAYEVIKDIRVHTEVGTGDTRALFFYASVAGQPLEEAQLLRFDEAGRIRELTLFGRPLPAGTAVMARIGPKLLRRPGRPGMGRLIGIAVAPIAALTRLGEKRLVPLADPNRARSGGKPLTPVG
jgi:ketosteroid isomerase-like protein